MSRADALIRVGVDATPLLGPRTGIGTYTERVLAGVAESLGPRQVVALALSRRPAAELEAHLPAGVRARSTRIPGRALHRAWRRLPAPPLEWFTGPLEVFHATNFVAPPSRRAAIVLTVHDLTYLHYPNAVSRASLAYRELVPRAIRRGAVVCVDSHAVADEVREAYGVALERLHVTHLGVDESWFDPPSGPPEDPRVTGDYLVALGTLEPRKNLAVIVDAYRIAQAQGRPLPLLVLVGGAGWGPPLQLHGIPEQQVVRTGYLDSEQVRRIVSGARAMVFPSRYEGFGMPPLEALAAGVPVVAADLPVTREVLGDQAAYADCRDAQALLETLRATLDQPVGTPATRRERAAGFRWATCVQQTLAAYRVAAGG